MSKNKRNWIIFGIAFALIVVIGLVIIFHKDKPPANTGKPGEGNSTTPKPRPKSPQVQAAEQNANKPKGAYALADNTPTYTASPFTKTGTAKQNEYLGPVLHEWAVNPLFYILDTPLDSGYDAVLKTSVYIIS
jgi:hypothetical protein